MLARQATQSLLRRSTLATTQVSASPAPVRCFGTTTPLQAKGTEEKGKKEANSDTIARDDFARQIAQTHDLTIAKSKRIIDELFQEIVEKVSDNKTVRINNFGTFSSYTSKAKKGRNPRSGEAIDIPAKGRIRFKPFTAFKDAIKSDDEEATV